MNRPLSILSILIFSSMGASAQRADLLSDSASVSLLTMLPGDEVYSQFGHSGYRILDPASGLDKTYNYGTFDFTQPLFIPRFVRGQLDYLLDTAPFELEVDKYTYLRRPMIEQRLALSPETVRTLHDLLETNALPENRAYRYDFFFDNCSTRLVAILDSALVATGHRPVQLPEATTGETFRQLIAPDIADTPLLRLGINVGLGLPTDRVASSRERSFLPVQLMNQFDGASIDGQRLVAAMDTVVVIPDYVEGDAAFDWPKLALWLVFLGGSVATARSTLQKVGADRWVRLGDSFLFTVSGIAGLLLVFLWFGTEHSVTGPNLNLLWAWPTHALAAWWLRRASLPRWIRAYLITSGIISVAVVIFWPILPQTLPSPILPLVLLLALRSFARSHEQ